MGWGVWERLAGLVFSVDVFVAQADMSKVLNKSMLYFDLGMLLTVPVYG